MSQSTLFIFSWLICKNKYSKIIKKIKQQKKQWKNGRVRNFEWLWSDADYAI